MLITRTSMLTGITRTMELPVSEEDYHAWMSGELIQNAMPHLSASEREFILTGMTDDEWDDTMSDWEADDYVGA